MITTGWNAEEGSSSIFVSANRRRQQQ
jgi:hypothetical protein